MKTDLSLQMVNGSVFQSSLLKKAQPAFLHNCLGKLEGEFDRGTLQVVRWKESLVEGSAFTGRERLGFLVYLLIEILGKGR